MVAQLGSRAPRHGPCPGRILVIESCIKIETGDPFWWAEGLTVTPKMEAAQTMNEDGVYKSTR